MEAVFLIGAALAATLLWQMRAARKTAPALQPDEDLEVILHLAAHEARVRHHADVEPLHLLSSLLQNEEIAATLEREGVDVATLEAHFQAKLEAIDATSAKEPRWSAEAQQLLIEAVAETRARQRDAVSASLLASRLLRRHPELIADIESTGLTRTALLFAVSHGAEEPPLALTDGAAAEVLLHNDDFTPIALVVTVLCEDFGFEKQAAVDTTMTVHNGPPAPIGRYPAADARRRLEAAVDRARAAGYPLRLSLRDAPGGPRLLES